MSDKKGDIPKKDYFRVKNDWWDALIRYRIPGEQRQLLDYIIRMTYGWRRKKAVITFTQFEIATGIKRPSVNRGLKALRDKNIIGSKKVTNKSIEYWFNKRYRQWVDGNKKVTSNKSVTDNGSTFVTDDGSKKVTTPFIINNNLNNNLNNRDNDNGFDQFWHKYPVKKAKQKAKQKWLSLAKQSKLPSLEKILSAIDDQLREKQILTENKKFCPEWKYPSTWLNQQCWDDVCELEDKSTSDSDLNRQSKKAYERLQEFRKQI